METKKLTIRFALLRSENCALFVLHILMLYQFFIGRLVSLFVPDSDYIRWFWILFQWILFAAFNANRRSFLKYRS